MSFLNSPDMNIPGLLGSFYSYSIFLTMSLSIVLGLFVLLKDFRKKLNVYWFLLSIPVFFWSFFIFLWSRAETYHDALLFNRLANYFAIFLGVMIVSFTEEYVQIKSRVFSWLSLFAGLAILGFGLAFPDLFIPSQSAKAFFSFYPDTGIIFLAYFLYFSVSWTYALLLMWFHYRRMEGIRKKQTGVILAGLTIAITGGSTTFFACFNIDIFPFGSSFTAVYIIFTTYAIIRYRAMEIDTVIHRTVIWLLSVGILILPVGVLYSLFKEDLLRAGPPLILILISGTLLLFLAYYNRLKPRIDHIFRRRSYDYQMVLSEMPSRIGSSLDMRLLCQNMFRELKETLYVRNSLLLINPIGEDVFRELDSAGYSRGGQDLLVKQKDLSLPLSHPMAAFMRENRKVLERELLEIDPAFQSVKKEALGFLAQNSLEILVPFTMQEKLIGILGLGKKENLKNYVRKDVELLEYIGSQVGITIDNALHHSDVVEKERIAEELRLGRQIQTSLLPHQTPDIPSLAIEGFMQPAREIGGDYYDFILQDGNVAVVIGDVSGKGVAAGLLMAMVKTAIYIYAQKNYSPLQVLKNLNQILNLHTGSDRFMTMLYLVWRPESGALTYSSAAHEHILLYRRSANRIETIKGGGTLLGIRPDIEQFLKEEEITLEKGDKVLLYTDGVTDALNPSHDRFGQEALKSAFLKYADRPALGIMESVKNDVYSFMGIMPQSDDITIVVLEKT